MKVDEITDFASPRRFYCYHQPCVGKARVDQNLILEQQRQVRKVLKTCRQTGKEGAEVGYRGIKLPLCYQQFWYHRSFQSRTQVIKPAMVLAIDLSIHILAQHYLPRRGLLDFSDGPLMSLCI